jgi:hypothetical protein
VKRYTTTITVELDADSAEDAYNYINASSRGLLEHDTRETHILNIDAPEPIAGS